jgi:glutamate synthase domain-containing protein 3
VARNIIASWDKGARERFVKVMPRDYKRALAERAQRAADQAGDAMPVAAAVPGAGA